MTDRRLAARDYKRPPRVGLPLDGARLRDIAIGLGVGLLIALIVYITDHRTGAAISDPQRPIPHTAAPDDQGLSSRDTDGDATARQHSGHANSTAAAAAGKGGAAVAGGDATGGASAGVGKFDFYQMLPRFEVVVPEREHGSRPSPAAQIDRPGIYFLQVGSYRDAAVAERIRGEVARLGITATVQRVAVDTDVWHRVRIGPIRDLSLLNRLRRQLQASKLDSLVIRVED